MRHNLKLYFLSAVSVLSFFGWIPQSPSAAEAVIPSDLKLTRSIRLAHSHELLGRFFALSGIHLTVSEEDKVSGFVKDLLTQKLPPHQATGAHRAIMAAAKKHRFDPLFILAVIQNESRFNSKALGTSGEVGLMQIRPSTARWVARHFKVGFKGAHSLEDPAVNIALGTQYIAYLRNRFDSKSEKYVAAYNMGETRLLKKTKAGTEPKIYTRAVLSIYSRFYSEFRTYADFQNAESRNAVALAKFPDTSNIQMGLRVRGHDGVRRAE